MSEDSFSPSHITKSSSPHRKGVSEYTQAKHAEYDLRDLSRAERHYRRAIILGDRASSAVKDLASLLHQQGRTKEAVDLLELNMSRFLHDYKKFFNLYSTLKKQLNSSGKCQISSLKVSLLAPGTSESEIRGYFKNPIRIQKVSFDEECEDGENNFFCVLDFNSHSSARKTLEGFTRWNSLRVEWIDKFGQVYGDAHYARQKIEEYRKNNPTFDFILFDRDPKGYVLTLPVDGKGLQGECFQCYSDKEAESLLGNSLYTSIFVAHS